MGKQVSRAESMAKKVAKAKAQEAADESARKSLLSFDSDDDDIDSPATSYESTSEDAVTLSAVERLNAFDVFKDIGDARFKVGDVVEYTVRKNSAHIATLKHPQTWEKLHKAFGDGTYQVQARSGVNNQYLKSETRTIGNPDTSFNAYAKKEEEVKEAPQAPRQEVPSFMEIMTLLMNQQAQAKNEARELSSSASQSSNQMMIMFMEMMKSQQAQTTQAQLQTMQMMTQITDKLSESQTRMFDKINERIEKMSETKKGLGFEELIDKMQKAQSQGFDMYRQFDELATKKAELQLEMMGGNDDNEEKEEKKESLIDSVIRSALPLIAGAQGQQQMPQNFAPSQRRPLPQPRSGVPTQAQILQRRQRIAASENAKSNARNEIKNKAHVAASGKNVGQTVLRKRNGLPTIDVTQVEVIKTHEVENAAQDVTLREKCMEFLPPFLGGLMLEATPAEEASAKTIQLLAENGVGVTEFLQEVTAEDLVQVAKTYSLPEEAHSWLNELYANIQTITRTDVGGESTPSIEPRAAEGVSGQP